MDSRTRFDVQAALETLLKVNDFDQNSDNGSDFSTVQDADNISHHSNSSQGSVDGVSEQEVPRSDADSDESLTDDLYL